MSLKNFICFPIYIVFLYLTLWQFSRISQDLNILLSFQIEYLVQFVWLIISLILTSLFFILSLTFASNWRIVLPFIIVASLTPFLIFPTELSISLCLGILISKCLVYLLIENKLKTYINFQPTALLIPYIKLYVSLLLIILSAGYYFSVSTNISQNGFQIPDTLVQTVIKVSPLSNVQTQTNNYLQGLPPILSGAAESYTNNLLVRTVKKELQNFINPYLLYIAPIATVLFFLTGISFAAILEILLYPLIFVIFKILVSTKFVTFKKEMREVKKLVI